MQLELTIDDVAHSVEIKATDLVAFERKYGLSYDTITEETSKLEYIFFLAWNACRRKKITDLDFDTWLDGADITGEVADVPLAPSGASS